MLKKNFVLCSAQFITVFRHCKGVFIVRTAIKSVHMWCVIFMQCCLQTLLLWIVFLSKCQIKFKAFGTAVGFYNVLIRRFPQRFL